MVLMALDHTRDFVHGGAMRFDPLDLTQTTPILFLTRWVTHFCAPIFVFLAGTSVYLQMSRGASRAEVSRFLLTRGAWLVLLEFTVIRVVVWFNVDYSFLALMQVIWALGVSMIVLAGLIYLPLRAIAVLGVGMIVLHNTLDGIRFPGWQPGTPAPDAISMLWFVLHQPAQLFPLWTGGPIVFVMYPLIPWIGVMAAGYAFGSIYTRYTGPSRQKVLFRLGALATLAFVVIRAINVYGDPGPWAAQSSAVFTVLSFLNTAKYPPSLLFLLMTLGPAMLILGALEGPSSATAPEGKRMMNPVARALVTFGRVPLFFYILQWPLAHGLAILLSLAAGKETGYLFDALPDFYANAPPDAGFSLGVTYLAWATVIAVLYVLCRWYAEVKARSRSVFLRYL